MSHEEAEFRHRGGGLCLLLPPRVAGWPFLLSGLQGSGSPAWQEGL